MDTRSAAIVGAGPAGLVAYLTLRYAGVAADEISVFDDQMEPLAAWRGATQAIGQSAMRSESEGHFFPTDFPGFALLDAIGHGSPMPLLLSTFNRYQPSLKDILAHADALDRHYGFQRQITPERVERIERRTTPMKHFALYDAGGELLACARHVILALGHGTLRWPAPLNDAEVRADLGERLSHAYAPKRYGAETVVIVGSGMAAIGEQVNVLRHGGRVIALRRSTAVHVQALSAPRCSFGGPWLDRYHRLDPSERSAVLAGMEHGTSPRPPAWSRVLAAGEQTAALQHVVGDLEQAVRSGTGVEVVVAEAGRSREIRADRVIAATGFLAGPQHYGLVRQLLADYDLATAGPHLLLTDDCAVPGLSSDASSLVVSGPLARWAFPAADSLAGMKYAARRFAMRVTEGRGFGVRRLPAWWEMVRAGWPVDAAPQTERCAIH